VAGYNRIFFQLCPGFADLNHGETVSPTGKSGKVMSNYYDDQAEIFAVGKFRLMMMDKKEIEAQSKSKLTLKAP
jgi:penicillin amidase